MATSPKKVIIAVHGIGDQFRYETVQAVANQVWQYCGQTPAIPLGRFHSKLYTAGGGELQSNFAKPPKDLKNPVEPVKPAAVVLEAMPPELPANFGFAEIYWADVPRTAVKDEHTLEESKKWARTVVGRVRQNYADQMDKLHGGGNPVMAANVIEEMIESIGILQRLLFLAEKAGVLKFNLNKILIDYLGDVQIVTEFSHFKEGILKIFNEVMTKIHANDPTAEIYIVAHSEGTVIAFLGLLCALSWVPDGPHQGPQPLWIKQVRGFMTIGSPINKHVLLWPELFAGLTPPKGLTLSQPIQWRNYYDYGDPIGFRLDATRHWLTDNQWLKDLPEGKTQPIFCFDGDHPEHDIGFAALSVPRESPQRLLARPAGLRPFS